MTDNGSCYRSFDFRKACRDLGLKHIRTKPYTPKTNGKAERFIQTSLREWAYAKAYSSSDERAAELPVWLHRYNWHRPHRSEEHTSELQSLMRISYAVFCLKKKNTKKLNKQNTDKTRNTAQH